MKAHGITGNNSGARAGSPGPSEPSTPAPRKKTLPGSRPSTNKKRKLAARGSDLDDEVKTEVKAEDKADVKQELAASNDINGSYMMNPTDRLDATTSTLVMSGESYKREISYGDDEMILVSDPQAGHSGTAGPIPCIQQMLLPHPLDSFYSFIDTSSDRHLPSPTSHPFSHEYNTDYSTQTMMPTDPAIGHWLQHHQNDAPFF